MEIIAICVGICELRTTQSSRSNNNLATGNWGLGIGSPRLLLCTLCELPRAAVSVCLVNIARILKNLKRFCGLIICGCSGLHTPLGLGNDEGNKERGTAAVFSPM